ncbi:hypothetical protein [Mycolicibacterium komossense]|uniref:Uncharacterized protein n=1 Tax=Mycolicibacterium komossense TaxID=1779 RepID=A0ABT3C9E1_9MYCO|nr:hypothetical protein [Mycolicibacterium komossense]MCV7226089.1 hypothetical protein [Mycolicibacterium komossense]
MALITDRPENLPSGNDLDNVEDPDAPAPKQRTEMYLSGAHVFTLDDVPSGLERFTFMVDVEVYEAGGVRFTGEDGETRVPICKVRRIGDMYLPGTTRPPSKDELAAQQAAAKAQAAREKAAQEEAERAEREKNEPPMFTEDGDPLDPDAPKPPAGDGIVDAEVIEDDEPWPGDVDHQADKPGLSVVGPAFSDGAKS